MYGMELIEANPDPVKSEVMSRAGELRSEGYDKSTALSMAWDDILGDDYEDEDDSFEVLPQSRRRSNPTSESSLPTIGIAALVGYLFWCFFTSTYKGLPWSFTPWKTVPISRRITAPRVIDSVEPVYNAKDITQETVTLIVP